MNASPTTAPQRADYMAGRVTHQAYYESWARHLGISFAKSPLLPRIRAALASGDEYLNTIPLREWDQLASRWVTTSPARCSAEAGAAGLAHHGTRSASLSDIVCALKAAATRDAQAVA